MAGARFVSRLGTASRRTIRGLDTSLSLRPISLPCGECASVAPDETLKTQIRRSEVTVEADLGDDEITL